MASELILQLQNTNGSFSCEKFDNLPSPKSAYLAICFTDNSQSENLANELKDELIKRISSLGNNFAKSSSPPPCVGSGVEFMHCQSLDIKDNSKLLIVVSDGQINTFANNDVLNWTETTLPVLPLEIKVDLPVPFNNPQVSFWSKSIDEVIPGIFGLLGISDEDLRIFISYKRDDTSAMAEQLFNELNHRGFEVFLDRFSIRPSINFQNRLYQELADKAMVLFLESENFLKSNWIQLEIAFAKKYRLGYLAFNIENAEGKNAKEIDSIDSQYRRQISSADLKPDGTIKSSRLAELIKDIESTHSVALYIKKNYLNKNIEAAINNIKQKSAVFDSRGFINDGSNSYKIWTTPRPPKPSDYQYIDDPGSSTRKIIFGPEFMEDKRKFLNDWLAEKAEVKFFNEGQLMDLIISI